jgi:hypothetical protein
MTNVIENNFIDLQKKTTHVLIEQKVIISEQELIDSFLDKVNETKKTHAELIPEYRSVIEIVVKYLSEDRNTEELITISESIISLVATTKRLIKSFDDQIFKGCYSNEVKEYKLLVGDINEVMVDIQTRLDGDNELSDIMNNL